MKKILMNDRGVALILVILMISIIVAITLQLNLASRSGIYEAANLGDGIRATHVAKSGFCMGVITQRRPTRVTRRTKFHQFTRVDSRSFYHQLIVFHLGPGHIRHFRPLHMTGTPARDTLHTPRLYPTKSSGRHRILSHSSFLNPWNGTQHTYRSSSDRRWSSTTSLLGQRGSFG